MRNRLVPVAIISLMVSTLADKPATAKEPTNQPNIIFVMLDDMGYGDLSSYGQQHIQMPNVDQMASQGIRFTNVYSGSPVCAPARSVLMTGQHTGHTTVRGNFGVKGGSGVPCSAGGSGWRVPLADEDLTVAEVLRQAGYQTGVTGKWGLGEPGTVGVPNRQGFDEWFGLLNQRIAHSYYPKRVWHNELPVLLEGNSGTTANGTAADALKTQRHYIHDRFTDFALGFIERHGAGDKPFFLYLPYTVPHSSFQVPELEAYVRATDWSLTQKVYASMLTRVDRDLGRIFERLVDLGIDEKTIVFFCSDNGAANRYDGVFDSSGPLRGAKRDLYEGGIRTVMVARWPGVIPSNVVSDATWYFADVLPTLADIAGAEIPENVDGVSVLPSLLSQPQPELHQRPLYWEFYERGFQQAARLGDWKAVRLGHNRAIELYDLANDVGETRNIADQHPERVAWFDSFFRSARTPSPDWPSPLDPN